VGVIWKRFQITPTNATADQTGRCQPQPTKARPGRGKRSTDTSCLRADMAPAEDAVLQWSVGSIGGEPADEPLARPVVLSWRDTAFVFRLANGTANQDVQPVQAGAAP